MSKEVAQAAVDLILKDAGKPGVLFYGGEPLLEKTLVRQILSYIQDKTHMRFAFSITTNGVLLDESFIKLLTDSKVSIGLSHDGEAQDICRPLKSGEGTFNMLDKNIDLLLKYQPYAKVLSVADPRNVENVSQMVSFFRSKGFRYLHLAVNYANDAGWNTEKIQTLRTEYLRIAQMYLDWTRNGEKIYFSSFDMKIASHIKGKGYHGLRQKLNENMFAVAPNGNIFFSSRFIDRPHMAIGNVFDGIDQVKLDKFKQDAVIAYDCCNDCALIDRCNYAFDRFDTDKPLPMQCTNEKLLIPIADYIAKALFAEQNELFIQKHYDPLYAVISLAEDLFKRK